MLNNSITIGLAVISLVCIYLIWENFKQSAKLRYLESSIHETIQTVQGLVNNSLTLPPLPRNEANHNYHPESMLMRNNIPQPVQSPQVQHKTSSLSLSEKKAVDSIQRSQVSVEDDLESVTEKVGKPEELEPLEITEELKTQIDNLTFIEPEQVEDIEDIEDIEDMEDMEEFEYNEDGDKSESESDNESMNGIEEIKDLKDLNEVTDINDVVEVVKTVEAVEAEEVKDIKEVEPVKETESSEGKYIKNPALLNEMSLKELREIAEKHNLGHRGTKEQLVTKIKRNLTMS